MKRHTLSTRLWHWTAAISLIVLFMSGLNIFNAHPRLYWGQWGFIPRDAWLSLPRFPGWTTIPGYYSLAAARDWHLVFSWVLFISLLLFMIAAILNGHIRRDLAPRGRDWRLRTYIAEIRSYLRFDFVHTGGKYGSMQKLSYAAVLFVLLPLIILTGLAMSPGMDAAWPWLTSIFGGRQSARSLHFIIAWILCAFVVVHLLMVLVSGPLQQIGAMIFGGRIDESP